MGIRAATVRRFALSLPEAEERETWETATFRVRNKIFVMFTDHERHAVDQVDRTTSSARSVAIDPEACFVPPYVGPSGWVGAVLSKADGDEVRELIVEAWRMTAPKRLLAAFDEGRREPVLLIPCPWCGPRDEVEFRYGGQAHLAYPDDPAAL